MDKQMQGKYDKRVVDL